MNTSAQDHCLESLTYSPIKIKSIVLHIPHKCDWKHESDRLVPWSSTVELHKTPKSDRKRCRCYVIGYNGTVYMHSGNGKSDWVRDCKRYSSSSPPSRSICRHFVLHDTFDQTSIINLHFWCRIKCLQSDYWCGLPLNEPLDPNPVRSSGS
jgi:hypothetical protein